MQLEKTLYSQKEIISSEKRAVGTFASPYIELLI